MSTDYAARRTLRRLREDLGPHLRPGDLVVMDKLGAHKVEGDVEALA
jgi:hypothetical protein